MPSVPLFRVLDASLNRASEGLRVVEDYVRFVLDDPNLTSEVKSLRHELAEAAASISPSERHAARDTAHDVGTNVFTSSEDRRSDTWAVCLASLKRSEQSLRSLEEYGKLAEIQFAKSIESLRYRLYILEKAIDVGRSSRDRLQSVRLCVLIDGQNSLVEFERLVSMLVEAGIGMIQLRDKRLADRDLVERAGILVSRTRWQGEAPAEPDATTQQDFGELNRAALRSVPTLAIINDRADVAVAVHADGVHVGQGDLPIKEVRTIVGTEMLIGVSTHNVEQARAAVLDGANYIGAGPILPSMTKDFDSFAGLGYLREVAARIRLPTFAIGGITAKNLPDVLSTGITRIAVGSAVTAASDPASATHELLSMLEAAPGR